MKNCHLNEFQETIEEIEHFYDPRVTAKAAKKLVFKPLLY